MYACTYISVVYAFVYTYKQHTDSTILYICAVQVWVKFRFRDGVNGHVKRNTIINCH